MTPKEKLHALMTDDKRTENNGAAVGEHLRDEDFIRLIENNSSAGSGISSADNGSSTASVKLVSLRRHLLNCDSCLEKFQDFYAFFAPAEFGENAAAKNEIDAAWQAFAPGIAKQKAEPKFWARLFPTKRNSTFFNSFGWAFAALLLIFTSITAFVAWQAKSENSQLAAQLEMQKQASEERLKTLEQSAQNSNAAETTKRQAEKDELQNQIARLQGEIERAKQQKPKSIETAPPANPKNSLPEKPDNALVAVNTPIYDVFPSDAVVRSGEQAANKLLVPNAAKNVVLILNAAGRADFPIYQAALLYGAGKTVWRGGGLRKDATGNFTLTIARAGLKTGHYRLKLSSGSQIVAEYPISVEIGK